MKPSPEILEFRGNARISRLWVTLEFFHKGHISLGATNSLSLGTLTTDHTKRFGTNPFKDDWRISTRTCKLSIADYTTFPGGTEARDIFINILSPSQGPMLRAGLCSVFYGPRIAENQYRAIVDKSFHSIVESHIPHFNFLKQVFFLLSILRI
jgi:hypothetical protein